MTPTRFKKMRQVLSSRQTDLTLFTDGVHKPQNLSAILRTCDAVGIHRVHWSLKPDQVRQIHHRTAGGSSLWVDTQIHLNALDGLKELKSDGFQIVCAHFSDRAIDFRQINYCQPTVVVMGAEKPGISEPVAEMADYHAIIPMKGMVGSYNVSVAAAVILNEAMIQRMDANLYDRSSFCEEELNQLLFRWGYPKLAEFCDRNQIRYPELDESGSIIYSPEWSELVKHVNPS